MIQDVIVENQEPLAVITKLKNYFADKKCKLEEIKTENKMKFEISLHNGILILNIMIEKTKDNNCCIRLGKVEGSMTDFSEVVSKIKAYLNL